MEGRATLLLMLGVDLPRIDCDTELFKQAVTQLVLNAVEAQDGPQSKILLLSGRRRFKRADLDSFIHGRTLPEDVYVTLEVIDTGRGISAAEIGRIFEPFYSTKLTGRGLGLSIVLGFMHRLGGAISVKSEPNQGSTFRLLFPAIPTSKA
jgi:signal transduction histidine kinase